MSVLTLSDVLAELERLGQPVLDRPDPATARLTTVSGVSSDSRLVAPGDLYAGLPGAHHHGAGFVEQARAAGATVVLTDPAGRPSAAASGLPVLVVADPRGVLGDLAAAVFGHPDSRLLVLGVTGTNGKTTSTFLLDAGLRAAGHRTGLVGTVETRVGDEVVASVRTTPEAADLQRLLASMVAAGCTAVSLEVSSHAIAQGRVDGLTCDVALFTNLSQDHLDFHPTMDDYFAAKADLFTPRRSRLGVVDVDSPWGRELAATASVPVTTVSCGLGRSGVGPNADWRAVDVQLGPAGSRFTAHGPSGEVVPVSVQLPGPFNVANALGSLVVLAASGVPLAEAARGMAGLAGVPGRMERVDLGQPYLAVVDYAHTPDAVATLLAAVRASVDGQVVLVLGCGGDRDPFKRPAMGAAAVAGADTVVLTSDNPRSEDPVAIIEAMRAGAEQELARRPAARLVVEVDRAAAIEQAVAAARAGDAVVVAGKGHETGQEVAGVVRPFDDRLVLSDAIQRAGAVG